MPHRISPSAFMRELRPEHYSDTQERVAYKLSSAEFAYHLDTITNRNQTHDFEIFCRKLCERTICPNLRPQTGPEGGGDSKADSETYPVAEEISNLTYISTPNSGKERWAFAFSAKKKWAAKVRNDVQGLVDTGRKYDRIICVTSRFARAKDRARIEDELTRKHGVPITIHDRAWIVNEIIENDRADLAFNYLNVGASVADSAKLGPTDYSRAQQLADIERSINDPDAYRNMETQLVTEALLAAKLSRGLERPRIETDGRFDRAIRLSDKHGTYRQQLEARYEKVWTAFWWYDDFEFLNSSYDDFESRALTSDIAKNLEFLGTLHQLLFNSVLHDHMTREACCLDERTERLQQALVEVAQDRERPNNSLEAETGLLRIKLNQAGMSRNREALSSLWRDYSAVLEKARGLGEYDADSLARYIEVAGQIAGNDPGYNELVEKLADFVGERKSEGEGALILLRRAQKLDFSDRFDMIRLLGKAVLGLAKQEYTEHLIEAAQLSALAYRSAGLLWAARASCALAAASIVIEGELDSDLSVSIVPTMELWAWISLELGHIPDFLYAIQMLNGFLAGLPLDEESQAKISEGIRDLDMVLGCHVLNLEESDLRRLEGLPDILGVLGLLVTRTALLYALGYEDVLREDGSLPEEESDEWVKELLSRLKSQPAAEQLFGPLVLNEEGKQTLSTVLLGMNVQVEIGGSASIVIAESILGSLEAFFATAIERDIAPHTEQFRIVVMQCESVKKPTIETNELDLVSTITWPRDLAPGRFDEQGEVKEFFAIAAAHVLGATCVVKDSQNLLEGLFENEAVLQRMTMIAVAPNSYNRITGRSVARLSDWQKYVRRPFPMREMRPKLANVALNGVADEAENDDDLDASPFKITSHKSMDVRSVIDLRAWDKARWRGCGYVCMGFSKPPYMALLFENDEAARKIFERWRMRFGEEDKDEEILVSVIRNLPNTNPHHYCVQISPKHPAQSEFSPKKTILMATRSMTMEPDNSQNLKMFLSGYEQHQAYYLIPAALPKGLRSEPEFYFDLAILKRKVVVKSAADVGEHDIENLALRMRGISSS